MQTTIELDMEDQQTLDNLLSSGRYASADEVVRQGLRLVRWHEEKLAELDATLALGLADIEAGRVVSLDEAFDPLIAKYEALAKAAA